MPYNHHHAITNAALTRQYGDEINHRSTRSDDWKRSTTFQYRQSPVLKSTSLRFYRRYIHTTPSLSTKKENEYADYDDYRDDKKMNISDIAFSSDEDFITINNDNDQLIPLSGRHLIDGSIELKEPKSPPPYVEHPIRPGSITTHHTVMNTVDITTTMKPFSEQSISKIIVSDVRKNDDDDDEKQILLNSDDNDERRDIENCFQPYPYK